MSRRKIETAAVVFKDQYPNKHLHKIGVMKYPTCRAYWEDEQDSESVLGIEINERKVLKGSGRGPHSWGIIIITPWKRGRGGTKDDTILKKNYIGSD